MVISIISHSRIFRRNNYISHRRINRIIFGRYNRTIILFKSNKILIGKRRKSVINRSFQIINQILLSSNICKFRGKA